MAGIEHGTCSKPAMSIAAPTPWSTMDATGSSAAHSPRRSTQLLLLFLRCSSTSNKLLCCVKDVPDASGRRL